MGRIINLALCFFPIAVFCQQKIEIGAFAGFANYQGDLVENPVAISETKLSYGGFLRYHLNDKVKVRANFVYGFISGSDENNKDQLFQNRGWSFESEILETTLIGEFHPLGRQRVGDTGIFRPQLSPYVGFGIGMANFTPKVYVTDPADKGLFPEPGEKSLSASIPIIAGIRADLFEFFSLGFEIGWRATLGDYLDGVSIHGNPNKNDWYVLGGFTASFFFGDLEPDYNFEPN